jgi:hypothetical protein
MNNRKWMTEVLVDMIKFAQRNNMKQSAKALDLALASVAAEVAVAPSRLAERANCPDVVQSFKSVGLEK